jgi:hypothetical protein
MDRPRSEHGAGQASPVAALDAGAVLVAALTVIFGGVVALGQLTAYDVWALLAGGRHIWTHGLPATDPFSYTAGGQPWRNHSWLTQLGLYLAYDRLGRTPLILAKCAVVMATLGLTWLAARRASGSPAAAGVTTALAALGAAPWWHLRPQLVSYLAWASFLLILAAWRDGRHRAVVGLPLVMVLWVNGHAGFAIGLAALGLLWLGILLERLLGRADPAAGRPALVALGIGTALTVLATLANPYGARALAFPLHMVTSRFALEASVDWYPPDLASPSLRPALAGILLGGVLLALGRGRPRLPEALLLAGLLGASLRSARHLPLLLLAGSPAGARLLAAALAPAERAWPRLARATPLLVAGTLGLGSIAGLAAMRQPTANPFLQELNEARYPVEVADFFRRYRPPPELFNVFLWAGYELWALPEYRVFIDNRFEVYPERVIRDYQEVTAVGPRWEAVLTGWEVRTLIVGRDSPLARVLRASGRWAPVFTGREAGVFVKAVDPLTAEFLARLPPRP